MRIPRNGERSHKYFSYEINGPIFQNLPAFLRDTKYQNPRDPNHSNFPSAKHTDQTLFQYLEVNPSISDIFQKVMTVYVNAKMPWTDVYPVDRLVADRKQGRVVVVDVGGGEGSDIELMRKRYPDLPKGSLVLQDLPAVIEQTVSQPPVEAQVHDAFQPQPVKGMLDACERLAAQPLHVPVHLAANILANQRAASAAD